MQWFKNIYNNFFAGFLISIIIVFFYTRPLDSPFSRIIAGDGFGYYAYLPAKYIYNDNTLEFKWFNEVYSKNYSAQTYKSADDNFLIKYESRRINKYYPGLSLLWQPFFITAHLLAQKYGYEADGYSFPYQLAIALASLFYLLVGLIYLRKLLLKLFANEFAALITPVLLFYGTHLYSHSININSLSHIYSFTFITMLCYFSWIFLNENKSIRNFLICVLCMCIVVCIRPINILALLILLSFIPKGFFKTKLNLSNFRYTDLALILLTILFIYNQFSIQYTQTGLFFANTYSNEKFYFNRLKLFDVLFSYHAGLFVYAPIVFIAIFGAFFYQKLKRGLLLLFALFLVIYIYSSWWYWPITTRALIDYYVVVAILLAAFIHKFTNVKLRLVFVIFLMALCAFYQLKNYQIKKGILDSYMTYKEIFWKNMFVTKKIDQCVIPPSIILKQTAFEFDYEGICKDTLKRITHSGSCTDIFDTIRKFTRPFTYKIPDYFYEEGIKKIRISFWSYFMNDLNNCAVYLYFYDKEDKEITLTGFFINETIEYNKWDKKEFGFELTDSLLAGHKVDHITWFAVNNELKNKAFIDDAKTEFILTDKSYEIQQ